MKTTVRLYLDFVRIGLMEGLAWRLRTVLNLISYPLIIVANYHLYRAVFAHRVGAPIAGHTVDQAIGYMVIVWTLRSIFWTLVDKRMGERVRSGEVAIDLIRPVSFPLSQVCHSIGISLQRFVTITLPLLVIAAFFISVPVPHSAGGWGLLLVSVALGYTIMTLTKLLVGVFAFYMEFNENLRFTFEMIQRLLGGLMIPLSFFPESVFHALQWLPFQYIYFIPAQVCLGKVTEPMAVLGIPLLWVAVLIVLNRILLAAGTRRLSIQGG